MKGRLFGVGVGPGDPELMTYKAVRTIEKCPVIAVPAKGREHAVSYRIAAGMVDNMEEKEYLDLDTPMTKDRQILNQNYEKAAKRIIEELEKGKDVAYLTLGDPTIYSTYMYIQRIIKEKGYETSIINGIPSFCAAASKLNESLADRADELQLRATSHRCPRGRGDLQSGERPAARELEGSRPGYRESQGRQGRQDRPAHQDHD